MFENANPEQREAIETTEGPLLIVAGPGTGKTFTLIQRTVNLVVNKHVPLSRIFISTYTVKAANEITKRLVDELARYGVRADLSDMYIGTFHSICERIVEENLEHTDLRKNHRVMDEFEQKYFVRRNYRRFKAIPGFDQVFEGESLWERCDSICTFVNNLQEELIDPETLLESGDPDAVFYGRLLEEYLRLRAASNVMDFASMQTHVHGILMDDPEVAGKLTDRFDYIMVDEYQDTNRIQEMLTLKLGSRTNNICVVGDEDQSMYRFRGATVRNILEFADRFDDCAKVVLFRNYRSEKAIIDFYNGWINNTHGKTHSFEWGRSRNEKSIVPVAERRPQHPPVVVCRAGESHEYCTKVLDYLRGLMENGSITDYNQVAFLFRALRTDEVRYLEEYLNANGIPVFSPRSKRFFQREEVRTILGAILAVFHRFRVVVSNDRFMEYCDRCRKQVLSDPDSALSRWVVAEREELSGGPADYGFSGLVPRMLGLSNFRGRIIKGLDGDISMQRFPRNISLLLDHLRKFEVHNGIAVIDPSRIDADLALLFNEFLLSMFEQGIDEYEDETVFAPSGHVSFMTFHQSKGLEFPVVFVGSLGSRIWGSKHIGFERIVSRYSDRGEFEDPAFIHYYDHWRVYYVAFSRPQSQLVLLDNRFKFETAQWFRPMLDHLPDVGSGMGFPPRLIHDRQMMESYSFTVDIRLYNTCPVRYGMERGLGFTQSPHIYENFGTLVHQTFEDMNRDAVQNGGANISSQNIDSWLDENLSTLNDSGTLTLTEADREEAMNQISIYRDLMQGRWDEVYGFEMPASVIHGDCILNGKVDLVMKDGDGYLVVDYKTERKPEPGSDPYNNVKAQLDIYAYLLERKYGLKINGTLAYYTGKGEVINFPRDEGGSRKTLEELDRTVELIRAREFAEMGGTPEVCSHCDFRFFCKR